MPDVCRKNIERRRKTEVRDSKGKQVVEERRSIGRTEVRNSKKRENSGREVMREVEEKETEEEEIMREEDTKLKREVSMQ